MKRYLQWLRFPRAADVLMKLEPRDRRVLAIGGAVAGIILFYTLVFSPISEDLSRKRDLIPAKKKELAEMRRLRDQYLAMRDRLQRAQAAASGRGPLLTEIEQISQRAALRGKIVSLKPQTGGQINGLKESIVEVRLDNVVLYDIVNYIHLLEKAHLHIKKLTFKQRFDNPKLLNSTILVSSFG